jgi:RNA polymerase sigma-70 factor (ECF subfamily)
MSVVEQTFAEHRGLVFSVAYRILGSATDAEDVVQEAWLRWSAEDRAEVTEPRGYLARIAANLAVDRLRAERARRETYYGPWLPEPILTEHDPAADAAAADSVSLAMLVVLETLSPLERAVFVLREAFGYSYGEIARFVDRSEASVRQTASRAREHVARQQVRYDTDRSTRATVTKRFLDACMGGDLTRLMDVLAPEVTLVSDGGGLAPAPRKAIDGWDLVARALVTFAGRMPPEPGVEVVDINGGPGIVVRSAGTPVVVISLHLVDGRVRTIHLISNPEKLAGIGAPAPTEPLPES